jgi:ubiquinone/menaquinone biosynthesis C-methylase UbiE
VNDGNGPPPLPPGLNWPKVAIVQPVNRDEDDQVMRAWNGVLFDKWVRFKHLLTTGLSAHGEALIARRPPQPGWRVLDLGCGFGDLSQQLAAKVGDGGEVVGVDVAQTSSTLRGTTRVRPGSATSVSFAQTSKSMT